MVPRRKMRRTIIFNLWRLNILYLYELRYNVGLLLLVFLANIIRKSNLFNRLSGKF